VPDTKHTVHRGRPRSFDPQQGVEIAVRLFRTKGFDAVGVAELTDAIGINPPSFYAAYGSKRALLLRAMEHYRRNEGGFAGPVLRESIDAGELLHRLFEAAAIAYSQEGEPCGCLIMECTRNSFDQEADFEATRIKEEMRSAIENKLANSNPDKAGLLADYVMMVLAGLSASARNGADRDKLIKLAVLASASVAEFT